MRSILSRYVAWLFVQAWALFTLGLLFLALIIDFAIRLGQFLDAKLASPAHFISIYYLHKIPFLLPYLPPTSLLLASSFTLIRLSRANELVPILMGGRSLRMICLPFVAAALLTGVGIAFLEEYVIPLAAGNMTLLEERAYRGEGSMAMHARSARGDQMYATRFNWTNLTGVNVQITLVDGLGRVSEEIKAKEAMWLPEQKGWLLSNGEIQPFVDGRRKTRLNPDGSETLDRSTFDLNGFFIPIRIEPEKFTSFDYYASYRSLEATRRLMDQYPQIAAYRAQFMARFVSPLSPLVLLLVGLPMIGVLRIRGSALVGGALCFLLVAAYFGAVLAGSGIGTRGSVPMEVASLAPTGLFLILGVALFGRMRT